jgi:hypothetical protein
MSGNDKLVLCEHITEAELAANRGKVLVLSSLEIYHQRPTKSIFAGYWMTDGDGPGLDRIISVQYHYGRMCWHLVVEHSAQIATNFRSGTLAQVIELFEDAMAVDLPDVRVVDYGNGVYGAKTNRSLDDPFALVDGGKYEVTSRAQGTRELVASVRNGRLLVSFLRRQGAVDEGELYEPHLVLGAEDWKSLKRVPAVATT